MPILPIGLYEGELRIFVTTKEHACMVVVSVFVNTMFILGGMIVQVPIPVPPQLAPNKSVSVGIVTATIPDGDKAGNT